MKLWRGKRALQLGGDRSRRAGGYRAFEKRRSTRLMRRLARHNPEDAPERALTRGYS